MENLFKRQWQKEMLIKKYASDHDWEIGYQRYYQFLTHDLYQFIISLIDSYAKGEISSLDDISKKKLTISCDSITEDFIEDFVYSYLIDGFAIGNVDYNDDDSLTICFNAISLHDLQVCFYDELQRLERTMKTPLEMEQELNSYMSNHDSNNYIAFLSDNEEQASNDDELKKYFDFLNMLDSNINAYSKKKIKKRRTLKSINYKIDKDKDFASFEAICNFLLNNKIAHYTYHDGWLFISFMAPVRDIQNAVDDALIDMNSRNGFTRVREIPFYVYYEALDSED